MSGIKHEVMLDGKRHIVSDNEWLPEQGGYVVFTPEECPVCKLTKLEAHVRKIVTVAILSGGSQLPETLQEAIADAARGLGIG